MPHRGRQSHKSRRNAKFPRLWYSQDPELDARQTALRAAVVRIVPVPALIAPPGLGSSLNVGVPGTLHPGLLPTDRIGNPLGVVDLMLLQGHLFPDHRRLLHPHLFFHHRDADLLILIDPAFRCAACGGPALDHHFLPGDGHFDGALFTDNLLADPNLAGLHPLLLGPQLLFPELDALGGLVRAGTTARTSSAAHAPPHGAEIGAALVETGASLFGAVTGRNRDQGTSRAEPLVEVLGILFGHAHPYQGTQQATRGRADPGASKGGGQRSACDDRPDAGNGQGANSCEESDHASQHPTTNRAGGCAFRCLRTGALDQLHLLVPVLDGHADLVLREAFFLEPLDRTLSIRLIVKETHDRTTGSSGLVISIAHLISLFFDVENLCSIYGKGTT